MNEDLLKVIRQLKDEILAILLSHDLTKEQQARRALDQINALYIKLGIVIEDIIPAEVLQAYLRGTASTAFGATQTLGAGLYAVSEISDNIMLDLKAAIRTAQMNTNNSIASALKEVQSELKQGVASIAKKRKVTAKVAESFNKYGMNSFVTVDGKQLPLDFYAEVVTRTNMRSAEIKGKVDWFADNGQDLVKINGVTPTCKHCWAHRGMVFSLSGKDSRFPAAEGNLPPYHPNCMCEVEEYDESAKDSGEVEADIEQAKRFDPEKDTRPENIREAYDKRQAANRQANYEKKRYAEMKAVLGDEAPKTIGTYRRMRRADSLKFTELEKKQTRIQNEAKALADIKASKYPKVINQNKQRKHIPGTNEFKQHVLKLEKRGDKPSELFDHINAQELVDQFSGTGRVIAPTPRHPPKESVKADRIVGRTYNKETGRYEDTDSFMIVYSNSGPHIYPKSR